MKRLSFALCLILSATLAHAAGVASFQPQGSAPEAKQVVAHFTTPMVRLGGHAPAPFDIDCQVDGKPAGQGEWLDQSTWALNFPKPLPAGTRCNFKVRRKLADLAGKALAEKTFSFDTGGIQVKDIQPPAGVWRGIDEDQVFVLTLDAQPDRGTVEKNVYCSVAGIGEKVPVRELSPAEKALLVKKEPSKPTVFLACRQRLPAGADVTLVWENVPTNGIADKDKQTFDYKVRSAFAAQVSCTRVRKGANCNPFDKLSVNFNAPVPRAKAMGIRLQGPGGIQKPLSDSQDDPVDSVSFQGPFQSLGQYRLTLPANFNDDDNRSLSNASAFPMSLTMDRDPPLAKFAADFGVLEASLGGVLPVTLRGVEAELPTSLKGAARKAADDGEILDWIKKLEAHQQAINQSRYDRETPDPREQSLLAGKPGLKELTIPYSLEKSDATEVVGLPLGKAGFYVVELASPRLGKRLTKGSKTMYVQAAALVTNLGVHFQHGEDGALVWVTRLEDALPVAGAAVVVRDCAGKALWQGSTNSDGVALIDTALPKRACKLPGSDWANFDPYFVSATTGDDYAFALSSWNEGIEPWRYDLNTWNRPDKAIAHAVFARNLVRPGETVPMKIFLRDLGRKGLALPASPPAKLNIEHEGSGDSYSLDLSWKDGAAVATFEVPKTAKTGEYRVSLKQGDTSFPAGSFHVAEFKTPTMDAGIQPVGTLVDATTATVDAYVRYLNGGASAGKATLRAVIQPRDVSFADYDSFVFANGDVKEGIQHQEGSDLSLPDNAAQDPKTADETWRFEDKLALDNNGTARAAIRGIPTGSAARSVIAELAFTDANGETQTVARSLPWWPANVILGIRKDGGNSFTLAALTPDGKPVPGVEIGTDLLRTTWFSHRKRLVGGFYGYDHIAETKKVTSACHGSTDRKGLLRCSIPAGANGNLVLRAATADRKGQRSVAHLEFWLPGPDAGWTDVGNTDRMTLEPDRKSYAAGDIAKIKLDMPFRQATALVGIEQEGIRRYQVVKVSGDNPVVEVPITADDAPNVFISVLALRGRVADPAPTGMVDLAKPSFRLGLVELKVGYDQHRLKVKVQPKGKVFAPRAKVPVDIRITPEKGSLPAGAQVAVAVVDAGLLELMDNKSYDLLEAMMTLRPFGVETATAQMQVVGKRHFGRKAVAHGGGGGRTPTRELFDTLVYWQGRVGVDENGKAHITVPLNDTLTRFRIVAVANAGSGMFGTGTADIESHQDLQLFSGLPAVARPGDRIQATVTVRNASDHAFNVEVDGSANGSKLPTQTMAMAPGASQEVAWPLSVTDATSLEFSAREANGKATDALKIDLPVVPRHRQNVVLAKLLSLDKAQKLPLAAAPPGDRQQARIAFAASLGQAAITSADDYLDRYPYTCLEQRLAKSVADEDQRKSTLADLPGLLDANGLARFFPDDRLEGSDVLTAYALTLASEAGWTIPGPALDRMAAGLAGFLSGRGTGTTATDLVARKLLAIQALARVGKAKPEMLSGLKPVYRHLPATALLAWIDSRRLLKIADDPAAETELRRRLVVSGDAVNLSTSDADRRWWLLSTSDEAAAQLLALAMDTPAFKDDVPKMAQALVRRADRGHWDSTMADAWSILALKRFATKYETGKVAGKATAAIGTASRSADLPTPPLELSWPTRSSDLELSFQGNGTPWADVSLLAAESATQPTSQGYAVKRSLEPVQTRQGDGWSRGDIAKVKLDVQAASSQGWVVVESPIPAGATILGGSLKRQGAPVGTAAGSSSLYPAWEERRNDRYRAYYAFVPTGNFSVEFNMRLNTAGDLFMPAATVEALYALDRHGNGVDETLAVKP